MKKSRSNSKEKNRKNSSPSSVKSNKTEDNQFLNKNILSLNNLIDEDPSLFINKLSHHNPVSIEEARNEENHLENNLISNQTKYNLPDVNSDRFNTQSDYHSSLNYSNRMKKDDKSYQKSYDKLDGFCPVPLRNLGNTCYMNAIVQTLFNLPTLFAEIRDSMDKAIVKNSELPFTMTKGIMELFEEYSRLRPLDKINDEQLERLLCIFKNNVSLNHVEFKSSGQHDAVEFLDAVINSVDDEYIKAKKLVPDCVNPIDKVFKIIYGEQSICENCGTKSKIIQTGQHCLILSLPEEKFIKEDLDLQDLLNNYFKTEKRESKCENCDCKERKTRMKVIKSPRVLILQLGRYTSTNDKRHEQINVPQIISLPKVVRKNKLTTKVNSSNSTELKNTKTPPSNQQQLISKTDSHSNLVDMKFELNGVICHFGSCAAGGHYVSYVFDRLNNKWYQCDDENISHVIFERVQEGSKSSGYCFFYLNKDKSLL